MVDYVVSGLQVLLALFLVFMNGFFVAVEFALTRVRQYSASEFDEPGLRRAGETTDESEIYSVRNSRSSSLTGRGRTVHGDGRLRDGDGRVGGPPRPGRRRRGDAPLRDGRADATLSGR